MDDAKRVLEHTAAVASDFKARSAAATVAVDSAMRARDEHVECLDMARSAREAAMREVVERYGSKVGLEVDDLGDRSSVDLVIRIGGSLRSSGIVPGIGGVIVGSPGGMFDGDYSIALIDGEPFIPGMEDLVRAAASDHNR